MEIVHVNTSSPYDVHIGSGILENSGALIKAAAGGKRALIVSDSNVAPLYLSKVATSLKSEGYKCSWEIIKAGEESKNFGSLLKIIEHAAFAGLSRNDVIVALGGGMVGDLAGFAAAIYMRGIAYVQIPTSVLAAVDSSVGGKTGVDLPQGKNLAGAFLQPKVVICDCEVFASLPDRVRNSGYAEIIKYAMIKDASIMTLLDGEIEKLVARCVSIKAEVVSADERESGVRALLNFGHSFGHAVEQWSGYELMHGEAVSIGMMLACEVAEARGELEAGTKEALEEALNKYELPTRGKYDMDEISHLMRNDKKADGDTINFILPIRVGECRPWRVEIDDIIGDIYELHNR